MELIPEDWSESVILPLFKKGDRRQCSNYRGIILNDIAAKVFVSLLLRRFQAAHDVARAAVNVASALAEDL